MPGYNLRMTDVQAAIGLVQLEKIDLIIARSREQARLYDKLLEGDKFVTMPFEAPWCKHNYQSYVIRLDTKINRDRLIYTEVFHLSMAGRASSRMGLHRSEGVWMIKGSRHQEYPIGPRDRRSSLNHASHFPHFRSK